MGKCYFKREWLKDPRYVEWLGEVTKDPNKFYCRVCNKDMLIGKNGTKALNSHITSKKHSDAFSAAKKTTAIFEFASDRPRPNVSDVTDSRPSTSTTSSESPCTDPPTIYNQTDLTTSQLGTRTLDAYVSNEKTLKSEIRWVLHLVSTHCSSRSSDSIAQLFSAMFSDSEIAKQFQCGRTKAGYLATFGIAPALLNEICDMVRDADFYTLLFDESFNSELQLKQMDIHLRFINDGTVCNKFFTSFFMGHAKAIDIEKHIKEAVARLHNNKLLQISMDGPNVNLKVYKDLSAELEREQTNNLVNIETCGLHVLHNAFKDGMKATKWEIQSLLKFAFYLFQESPARREDFFNITSSRLMPLQFCGHRWLENLHAAERFILVWPSIKSYVNACREGKTSEPICKSYKALSDAMSDKLVLVKLHCSIHVMKILQPFLKKYQSNVPLVPYLASDLFDIVKRIYSLILTDEALSSLTMDGVLDPTKLNKEQFKSHSKINLGCSADEALMKLVKSKTVSERDALGIHLDFQKLCISIISKITQKSPIAYQLARDVTCINPENVKLPNASERFHNLVKELHAKRWLSPDEVNDSLYQYKSMCSKVLENLTVETRLDQFYRALDLEGMDALKKVINMVLTMSHGNAEVERGFSVNKEVSVENMAERSIIARRLICQFIKDNGNCPAMVPLGKKMLTSCSGAYQKYKTSLEEERKKKELGEKTNTKKRKAEEKKGMDVKRRKLELDIDLLIRSADELSEEAEQKGTSGKEKVQVHELIVKSNALRKDAKAKKAELVQIDCSIKALEQELALL